MLLQEEEDTIIYKNPNWFSFINGFNLGDDGKIFLISEKGNEGSKKYASA